MELCQLNYKPFSEARKISKKVLNELACKKWWKICQFLTLSEVTSVTERSPAQVSGLRSGDFLVKCQEDLVIFQSHEDIETNLRQIDDLTLKESFSFT